MKQKKILFIAFSFFLISFSSCLKDKAFLDVGNTKPVIEFSRGSNGLSFLTLGTLPDTAELDTAIAVDIASPQVLNYDVTVNIKFDTSIIAAYNKANPDNLLNVLPDSCFSIPGDSLSVTIPAGYRIGKFPIKIYPPKIDPKISYALPFSISSVKGSSDLIISGNMGKLMYAFIGNIIAGEYKWDFTRWSAPSNAGDPDGTSFTGESANFVPDNPTTIEVHSGYFIQPRYVLSFTNADGVPTNFKLSFNADDLQAMSDQGVTVTDGPHILEADPDKKIFKFQYTTTTRYVIDTYYQ